MVLLTDVDTDTYLYWCVQCRKYNITVPIDPTDESTLLVRVSQGLLWPSPAMILSMSGQTHMSCLMPPCIRT